MVAVNEATIDMVNFLLNVEHKIEKLQNKTHQTHQTEVTGVTRVNFNED